MPFGRSDAWGKGMKYSCVSAPATGVSQPNAAAPMAVPERAIPTTMLCRAMSRVVPRRDGLRDLEPRPLPCHRRQTLPLERHSRTASRAAGRRRRRRGKPTGAVRNLARRPPAAGRAHGVGALSATGLVRKSGRSNKGEPDRPLATRSLTRSSIAGKRVE
jgi:hypothetical protein